MSDFRKLNDAMWVSQQLVLGDLAEAARQGVTMIINNRPEGEADDQTSGQDMESAAHREGMEYLAIPISPGQFGEVQVAAMADALDQAQGRVLAYCRSGTRSTMLWALTQASLGMDLDVITAQAAGAGYDVAPLRPKMENLAAR